MASECNIFELKFCIIDQEKFIVKPQDCILHSTGHVCDHLIIAETYAVTYTSMHNIQYV
jgi:hypothetical protein